MRKSCGSKCGAKEVAAGSDAFVKITFTDVSTSTDAVQKHGVNQTTIRNSHHHVLAKCRGNREA